MCIGDKNVHQRYIGKIQAVNRLLYSNVIIECKY